MGEAKGSGPLPKRIQEVLAKYKDVLTNELPQALPPKREVDHKMEMIPGSEPPSKCESPNQHLGLTVVF